MQQAIAQQLLAWYDLNARVLPWRGVNDPYRTWVSETMLQQTRVETVKGYYARFMERFPTVAALAQADEAEVLKMWEGLGYYSRARNLHQGAQQVMAEHGGMIPSDPAQLRSLKGVGPYTAGAIASIAFGQPVPAVDGNVIRVLSRLMGIRDNVGVPSVRRLLEAQVQSLVPQDRPGDFNQALMDLGSAVCVPGTPSCDVCPLADLCSANEEGDADELPVLPRKKPPKELCLEVCLVLSGNAVLVRQRTEALLKGMWVFPMLEQATDEEALIADVAAHWHIRPEKLRPAGDAKHVFTHQVWQMRLWHVQVAQGAKAPQGMRFVTLPELRTLPVPAAMRAALREAECVLDTIV